MAGGLNTAHDPSRRVDLDSLNTADEPERTQWQRRYQTLSLKQYNRGERFDYRGPPDMKEYVGGNVGRGPRPVKEPSPKYRPVPEENWQRPLSQVKEGESRWTGTPPDAGNKRVGGGDRRRGAARKSGGGSPAEIARRRKKSNPE